MKKLSLIIINCGDYEHPFSMKTFLSHEYEKKKRKKIAYEISDDSVGDDPSLFSSYKIINMFKYNNNGYDYLTVFNDEKHGDYCVPIFRALTLKPFR